MSIRSRLAIAVAIVLLVTLALLGTVFIRSTRAAMIDQLDQRLADEAMFEVREGRRGEGGPKNGDRSYYYKSQIGVYIFSPSGELLFDEPSGTFRDPDPPPRLPETFGTQMSSLVDRKITVPSNDGSLRYRMLVLQQPDSDYVVAVTPLTDVNQTIARLIRILLAVGAAALVAATLASWWLIRRGLRPVDRMVDTAAAIAAGDLGRRVPDADPRTELGRLGGALNEMLHQIERAIQARTASEDRLRRFVADAAHELRTPLTSLRGYAELYRQGALVGEVGVANAMRRIEAEGARMARLVDDMLLLARLDQQRGIERKPVDVVTLVREAAEDFRAVAPDRPLIESIDGDAVVTGDPARLRQVLDNLLTNARTHAPARTAVHLSVAREGNQVAIAVADEGRGIPEAERAKVFERFWRADPARGRGGTGLGLAIVASLVEAHGGTVAVDGPPGMGARFTVRLPLLDTAAKSATAQRWADDARLRLPPDAVPQPAQPLPEG